MVRYHLTEFISCTRSSQSSLINNSSSLNRKKIIAVTVFAYLISIKMAFYVFFPPKFSFNWRSWKWATSFPGKSPGNEVGTWALRSQPQHLTYHLQFAFFLDAWTVRKTHYPFDVFAVLAGPFLLLQPQLLATTFRRCAQFLWRDLVIIWAFTALTWWIIHAFRH